MYTKQGKIHGASWGEAAACSSWSYGLEAGAKCVAAEIQGVVYGRGSSWLLLLAWAHSRPDVSAAAAAPAAAPVSGNSTNR